MALAFQVHHHWSHAAAVAHTAAETHILQASAIDEDMLAKKLSKDLKTNFKGVEDVLFLSLYKTDVPRG